MRMLISFKKTTVFRIGDDFNITLNTGDVTLSDKTKGNIYTDIEPMKGFIIREAQIVKSHLGSMQTPSTASMGSTKTTATATGSATGTGSAANLAATSATESIVLGDKDESTAGKSAANWFAGAAALAVMLLCKVLHLHV